MRATQRTPQQATQRTDVRTEPRTTLRILALAGAVVCAASPAIACRGLAQQAPAGAAQPADREPGAAPAGRLGVSFDGRGWPVVGPAASRVDPQPVAGTPAPAAESAPTVAGSDTIGGVGLAEVFAAVQPADAFRALGGVTVRWRLTVHGPSGESIGTREIVHLADASAPDRDRLEFGDGMVYGRTGTAVFAERHGMPWPTRTAAARQELELLGLHLRLPWAFADARRFVVAGAGPMDHAGQPFTRVRLLRRGETVGPSPDPNPTDAFELWCPREGGAPRQWVHTLASSGQQRRVLLEDWRQVRSLRVPFRRVYVDRDGRPTTTLEVLDWACGGQPAEREFRLR